MPLPKTIIEDKDTIIITNRNINYDIYTRMEITLETIILEEISFNSIRQYVFDIQTKRLLINCLDCAEKDLQEFKEKYINLKQELKEYKAKAFVRKAEK